MMQVTPQSLDRQFANLLAGVRKLKPRCADCSAPMDVETTGIRTRLNDAGETERVCTPCFLGEIAEELIDSSTRVLATSN